METCQPPNPHTQAPTFTVPPGACDCHQHIFGPPTLFPYASPRSFTPPDALEEDYLRMRSILGFQRTVVVQASVYGGDHRRLIAAIQKLGVANTRGVGMVDRNIQPDELQALHDAGVRATRFITTAKGGPGLEDLREVARCVAPLGWHIEIYIPIASWPELLPVIDTLATPVVLDHMASMMADRDESDPVFRQVLQKLEAGRHWVKLCGYRASVAGYPYADVPPLARKLVEAAPDRCVWGTDWPHTNIGGHMPDDGELLNQFAEWMPDAGLRQKILVENPTTLYRF